MRDIRLLILTTPESLFNEAWGPINKKHFKTIIQKIEFGEIEATELQKNRLYAFNELLDSKANSAFWSNESNPWTVLMSNNVDLHGPGHLNNIGGVIGGTDTYALKELERDLVASALNKQPYRVTRGTWYQRLNHPYFKVKKIIQYFDQIRLGFEYIDALLIILRHYGAEFRELKTLPEELAVLQKIQSEVLELRKKIRQETTEILGGQDIFTGGWHQHEGLDIYKIAKQIDIKKALQGTQRTDFMVQAETMVEHLIQLRDRIRLRSGLTPKPLGDYLPETLRILHHAHKASSTILVEQRMDLMKEKVKGLKVRVTYDYTETTVVTRTDANGKTHLTTKTEVKSDTDAVELSYHDVLVDRLDRFSRGRTFSSQRSFSSTITKVEGKERVLNNSLKAFGLERQLNKTEEISQLYRELLQEHSRILLENDSQRVQNQLLQINEELEELKNLFAQIRDQKAISTSANAEHIILSQWEHDDPKHFKKRMQALEEAQNELYLLVDVYQQQLRKKDPQLVIQAARLDHTQAMSRMRFNAGTYYMARGGLVGGAGYSFYSFYDEIENQAARVNSYMVDSGIDFQAMFNAIMSLF